MASKNLLLKVARWKFEEDKTQEEIVRLLHADGVLTSLKNMHPVSEMLAEASLWLLEEQEKREKARKLPVTREMEFAQQLCKKYGLLDARVVTGGKSQLPANYPPLLRRYGRAAAEYFDDYVSEAEDRGQPIHVCFSGGQSALDMATSLTDRRRSNVHFYSAAMIGRGLSNWSPHVGPETTATLAWAKSGRIPRQLFFETVAPYSFSDEDLNDTDDRNQHDYTRSEIIRQASALGGSPEVQKSLAFMNARINMAVAGLGLVTMPDADSRSGLRHVEKLTMLGLLEPLGIDGELLAREGAVGDFTYTLFDKAGKTRPKWQMFITPGHGTPESGIGFYRKLVRQGNPVIVMAGIRKEAALMPALETKMFNVLVTDAFTAQKLLGL